MMHTNKSHVSPALVPRGAGEPVAGSASPPVAGPATTYEYDEVLGLCHGCRLVLCESCRDEAEPDGDEIAYWRHGLDYSAAGGPRRY